MTETSQKQDHDLDSVVDEEPRSKKAKFGKAAHGGDQAGPSSDQDGKTIAPQKGNPREDDRAQG